MHARTHTYIFITVCFLNRPSHWKPCWTCRTHSTDLMNMLSQIFYLSENTFTSVCLPRSSCMFPSDLWYVLGPQSDHADYVLGLLNSCSAVIWRKEWMPCLEKKNQLKSVPYPKLQPIHWWEQIDSIMRVTFWRNCSGFSSFSVPISRSLFLCCQVLYGLTQVSEGLSLPTYFCMITAVHWRISSKSPRW